MGFIDFIAGFNIYLGSRSPRRKLLLEGLSLNFKVWVKEEVEEVFDPGLDPRAIAEFLAKLKATPYKSELKNTDILITADTIVASEGKILQKPESRTEAIATLESLSGREHDVITGVCLSSADECYCFTSSTSVKFAELEAEEIEFYVDEFKPYDKAGAYGIQEWIGFVGVESIRGSYFNVMGLPVQKLYSELKTFTSYHTGQKKRRINTK